MSHFVVLRNGFVSCSLMENNIQESCNYLYSDKQLRNVNYVNLYRLEHVCCWILVLKLSTSVIGRNRCIPEGHLPVSALKIVLLLGLF